MSAVRAGRRALLAVVGLFLAAAALVAVTVPFHATDALIYGRWSRLIELGDGIHFDGIGPGFLHRPLVYVVQGGLWDVFGFHEWLGRVWALAFTVVLVWAVWRVAASDRGGALAGAIAAALLVCSPDVVVLAASGLTDVPVAAMVALAGALALWPGTPAGRRRAGLAAGIAVAAALAGLAKPSAFTALGGLFGALAIGDRAGLRDRLLWRGAPLALGGLVALAWDAREAARLDTGLVSFLQGAEGTVSESVVALYGQLNAQSRGSFVAGMEWLGPYLVLPLL
ncbi:MAG TPA: glycosyltransferase family 39 protein, partial [Capillimicrobium sp.]